MLVSPAKLVVSVLLTVGGVACGSTAASAPEDSKEQVAEVEAASPDATPKHVPRVEKTAPTQLPGKSSSVLDAGGAGPGGEDEYIACGCGCGASGAGARDVKECVPTRKALKKIEADDVKSSKDPHCAVVGASLGSRYRLCPGVK